MLSFSQTHEVFVPQLGGLIEMHSSPVLSQDDVRTAVLHLTQHYIGHKTVLMWKKWVPVCVCVQAEPLMLSTQLRHTHTIHTGSAVSLWSKCIYTAVQELRRIRGAALTRLSTDTQMMCLGLLFSLCSSGRAGRYTEYSQQLLYVQWLFRKYKELLIQ